MDLRGGSRENGRGCSSVCACEKCLVIKVNALVGVSQTVFHTLINPAEPVNAHLPVTHSSPPDTVYLCVHGSESGSLEKKLIIATL